MPNCTSLNTMCDTCRIAHTRVRGVHPAVLDCPEGAHPVIFRCSFTGTYESAKDFIASVENRLSQTFGSRVPVHAAARRAVEQGSEVRPWIDLTPELSCLLPSYPPGVSIKRRRRKSSSLLSQAPRLIGLYTPSTISQNPRYERIHAKPREITMLVDFPRSFQPRGEMEEIIIMGFGKDVDVTSTLHPEASGHACLHRLKWWWEIHPEEKQES